MKCPKCQHENPTEAKFCRECGTKLPSVCPHCGYEVSPQDKFCMECGTKLEEAPSTVPPKLEDMQKQLQSRIPQSLADKLFAGAKQMQGEYRLVTAVFADVSGSSGMAREMPLEQYVDTMNDCFKMMVDTISIEYEGSINRFIGDCVLAFFGAPITHENDAERAILAALDIREGVKELGLDVSIGINTGTTYVGEMGSDLYLERSAWGPDVDFAKRLQEAAKPGEIYVGTSTYRLTSRAFDFERPIDIDVKGMEKRQIAYPVLRVREHPEKLRGIEGLRARMIGREREFADLKEAADNLISGRGGIVSIVGEAGLGKSRLALELKEYLKDKDVSWYEGRSISIGQTVSYWPFLDILRTYLNLSDADSEYESSSRTGSLSVVAQKLKESMTELFPQRSEDILPLLGHLLSIKFGDELDEKLAYFTPEQIRHQTLMRLRDIFTAIARRKPLLLILEDLHWADDLSLDLISLLMDELAANPLMLLCIYRPEREHRCWQISDVASRKCLERYTEITLKKLSAVQSRQLVESLLEIENLPEPTKDMILKKSEGNPFFIEEVIRSLIDRDLVYREDDRWKARREIEDIDVPDTIQSVLLSRVDRLEAETKYVLQCASVIGRLFRYRLLSHLAQRERALEEHLSQLEEKDLVYEERTVPELEYAFKHAFTQEATYQGILEQKRREFHHQVAVGIERFYRERLEDYYEELAHHYSKSEDIEKAVEYLLKAGEKAKRSYANEAAISHFNKALEMLEQYEMERNDWKLEALRGLGEVYFGIGKTVEAEKAFEGAIALAKEMELPSRQLARLYDWAAEALFWQSRFDEVIRYGEMGLEILGDDTECLEAALMNSKIAAGNVIAAGNAYKNQEEKWREYTHRNMTFIKKLPYLVEISAPYFHIIIVLSVQDRDLEAAWEWSKELEARAGEHNDLRGLARAWAGQGSIFISKGDYKNGLSLVQKSLDMFQRIGDTKHAGTRGIAEILFNSGNIEEAEARARVSLKLTEQVGDPRVIADAHSQLGAIAMCQRLWEEAIVHFQKYLEGWQAIGNPFQIASAHLQLGRAYLKEGDYQQAIRFFEKVTDRAIETHETQWEWVSMLAMLANALGGMKEAYMALGTPEKFLEFCRSFKEQHADVVKKFPFRQWYLELAQPSEEFSNLVFADDFDTGTIDPSWDWIDEFEDCSYKIVEPDGLELCAANGRDLDGLNLSAPRLMREISGDFAVEIGVSSASDKKPRTGGLLVWKDKDNFLRFEKGIHGQHEVRLHGYVSGKYQVAGRGLLSGDKDEEIHLRLERAGENFSAYCSMNGENWLTCGKITLPLDDPIQIGIYAIGMIDRTIYCGSFKDGTATLFREFKLWTQ